MARKYKTLLLSLGFVLGLASPAYALDGLYLGGQVGFVGLSGDVSNSFNSALGFGIDLGLRANPIVDVVLSGQRSSHSASIPPLKDLTLYSATASAAIHFLQIDDFDLSVLFGPGFYFFNSSTNESKFGLHGGLGGDVVIADSLRVGILWKYHGVFGADAFAGSYYTVMMRVGYLFNLGQ